jgi:hypothetical protein
MRRTVTQYLEEMTEATERVAELAHRDGLECTCSECRAAWEVFSAIQDDEPPELVQKVVEEIL